MWSLCHRQRHISHLQRTTSSIVPPKSWPSLTEILWRPKGRDRIPQRLRIHRVHLRHRRYLDCRFTVNWSRPVCWLTIFMTPLMALARNHRSADPLIRWRSWLSQYITIHITVTWLRLRTALPSRILTCTELDAHCCLFVLVSFLYFFVSGYMCARLSSPHSAFESTLNSSIVSYGSAARQTAWKRWLQHRRTETNILSCWSKLSKVTCTWHG